MAVKEPTVRAAKQIRITTAYHELPDFSCVGGDWCFNNTTYVVAVEEEDVGRQVFRICDEHLRDVLAVFKRA